MKQLSLLGILLCLLVGTARAATVSGFVSSVTACTGLAGQKVYISDSLNTWSDSTLTNSIGAYSFTIPGSVPNPTTFHVSTAACGDTRMTTLNYSGSSMRTSFILCGGWGEAISVGLYKKTPALVSVTGPFVTYLIRRDVDPVTFDTSLTAIDSAYNEAWSPGYSFFRLPCVPTGTYLVKGALLPANANYASLLPTYHDSVLNWSGATPLNAANFSNHFVDIAMVSGTNPGGAGFIGGSVLLGANKSAGVGDPLSSRILLLTNAATGQAVAYTYSDAAGKFQFPNLAYGTYKIFGDAGGKTNPPLTVILSATQKTVNNIVFEENNKTFKGHFNTVGVGPVNNLAGVSVFPNPVTDFAHINGLAAINGSKTILLSDITGAIISRQTITQDDASISTSGLPAGVYLLQVQTEAGNASFRIMK